MTFFCFSTGNVLGGGGPKASQVFVFSALEVALQWLTARLFEISERLKRV